MLTSPLLAYLVVGTGSIARALDAERDDRTGDRDDQGDRAPIPLPPGARREIRRRTNCEKTGQNPHADLPGSGQPSGVDETGGGEHKDEYQWIHDNADKTTSDAEPRRKNSLVPSTPRGIPGRRSKCQSEVKDVQDRNQDHGDDGGDFHDDGTVVAIFGPWLDDDPLNLSWKH